MQKLIQKFKDQQTIENAKKLVAYVGKHPMAMCMVSSDDNVIVKQAYDLVNR